jgi:hypothetical protein
MPNNLIVSGNLTINGTATYVNTQSISAKDPLFEVANDNNTTDAVDIGYYGRYYDTPQLRVEFTGLFRDASDAGKFKFFTGLVDEPTNVVNTTGVGYTVGTLVANFEGNLAGTANAANQLSTARTIAASGDATWSVSFDGSTNVTSALTLANTGVTATTYGTSTAVPTIAIDSKGRITSASNTNITFPVTTVNGAAGTVVLTTTNIAEGTNQYFTSARAQSSITGGASSVVTADLTASRALVSDGTGKIAASASTTATEIGYVAGVTSAIQTQINTKAADNLVVHLAGAETITGAKTFTDTVVAPQIKANTSGGLSINANSGTQIANLGAGGGANMTLYGGLTGTSASFSSSVTASSLIKSGGTSSQFLMADGSVNTSVLASGAYLPLAGGTLTGALSGTSATFSGVITINNNIRGLALNRDAVTNYNGIGFQTATVQQWFVGMRENLSSNDYVIYNESGYDNFKLSKSTGAATFSSDISGKGSFNGYAGSTQNLLIDWSASSQITTLTSTELFFGTNAQRRLTITSGGNVYIGLTSSGSNKFAVSADGTVPAIYINSSGGIGSYYFGTGSIYSNAGVLTNTNPSDKRLKDNINDISWGLKDILKLRPVSFHWIDDKINQGVQFGFIAQEVLDVMPEAIKEFGDDIKYLGLEKDAIYATLVKAVQEQQAQIEELKAMIAAK